MTEVTCKLMECIFNRKIRKDFGICKRNTITISEMNLCIDAMKITSKGKSNTNGT